MIPLEAHPRQRQHLGPLRRLDLPQRPGLLRHPDQHHHRHRLAAVPISKRAAQPLV